MNINNNALLNTLVKTLTPSVQAKLEKLSVDGKIDLSTFVKGKSVQTLLSGLFNDLITRTKMKSDVSNVLGENKNILSPKNIKGDLKQIINLVKIEVQPTTQVKNIVDALRNSLADIKILDAKIIKNNMKNSGVFLESKILQKNNSTVQNLSLLSFQLKSQLVLLQNVVNDAKVDSPTQLKNNLLNEGFLNLKKTIGEITQQIQVSIRVDSTQINKELTFIEQKINTLQESKANELKIPMVKDLILDGVKLANKVNTSIYQELLKNNIGNIKNISEDVKFNLLLLKEIVEKSAPLESQNKELKVIIDKTLSSIDYYQLSSFASGSNHFFLPFIQEEVEDADIKFNNQKDEFSCMITLSLKQYGDLKVLLVLDEKSELSINIGVEQEEFKKMIQLALKQLRIQINSVGLLLVNLNVFDINDEKSNELKAYSSDGTIDFGLDMKV